MANRIESNHCVVNKKNKNNTANIKILFASHHFGKIIQIKPLQDKPVFLENNPFNLAILIFELKKKDLRWKIFKKLLRDFLYILTLCLLIKERIRTEYIKK